MSVRWFAIWFLLAAGVPSVFGAESDDPPDFSFSAQIRPLLANRCFTCHGPDAETREAGLRLDQRAAALAELDSGSRAIVPGQPDESELWIRITSSDEGMRMPPDGTGDPLNDSEIERIRRWIAAGAPYEQHWSFVPLEPVTPPQELRHDPWVRQPLDAFVLRRLRQRGLEPAEEADRYTLIRRLSLDLTGLPPSPAEVRAFVEDPASDADQRLIDRLLQSPAYGERWARVWLDLARYADSAGYAQDPPRVIWRYRDWVIDAWNRNLPFDQFTIEQLAGDLLPEATSDQQRATAFHRNTMTNSEGGTDDEEFRMAAVVDRVNTTMQVWMGLTMGCAQCHTHKYDPISQEEYYRFLAVFNNTQDADRGDESPTLQEVLPEYPDGVSTPVMRELPTDQRRATHIQIRGNFRNLGDAVSPGVPAAFHPLPQSVEPDRLAIAHWLVDPRNPLTARVAVNRFWEQLFGVGLVETSEDFGTQGEPPSHPELLDYLAFDFQQNGWDCQRLLRQIVTSATYRQASHVTPRKLEFDPDNRWLSRGASFRLSGEMIRDQALAVAGLLSDRRHGPSVRPPQPALGLNAAFGGSTDWETSPGEDRYRRSLYTFWRRTTPYPSLITFDAPSREVCTIRRLRTNTPLQALVTLNDPVFWEAAQGLARRITEEGGGEPAERVAYAVLLCLARPPAPDEQTRLVGLFHQARTRLQSQPEQAERLATEPLGPLPPETDVAALAAWTVVSNVLLNLDETLSKR